jgi:hypothetical protein
MVGYVHTQRCGGSAGLALGYHIFAAMRLLSRPCLSPRPALRTPHFRQIVQNKQNYVRYVDVYVMSNTLLAPVEGSGRAAK